MIVILDQKQLRQYNFPAKNCLPGSAWHDWMKQGAHHARNNPEADMARAARIFAGDVLENSAAYGSMVSAFLEGARRYKQLTAKEVVPC